MTGPVNHYLHAGDSWMVINGIPSDGIHVIVGVDHEGRMVASHIEFKDGVEINRVENVPVADDPAT